MNRPLECPYSPDLVELLSERPQDAPAELLEHVESCLMCRRELARLKEGYALIEGTAETGALRRTEDAVLAAMRLEQASGTLPVAVRGGEATWRRHLLPAAGVVLMTGLATPVVGRVMKMPFRFPGLSGAVLLLPFLFVPALFWPARQKRRALGLGLFAAALLQLAGMDRHDAPGLGQTICLLLGVLGAMGPAALLGWVLSTYQKGALSGALLGASAWSAAMFLQNSLCHLNGPLHVLGLHLLPLVLCSVAFAWIYRSGTEGGDAAGSRLADRPG